MSFVHAVSTNQIRLFQRGVDNSAYTTGYLIAWLLCVLPSYNHVANHVARSLAPFTTNMFLMLLSAEFTPHKYTFILNLIVVYFSFSGSNQGRCRLGLIDFGCAIDVELFPPGTRFSVDKNTESFECIEMKTQRPWTTQVFL